jgi:hypothetical protein
LALAPTAPINPTTARSAQRASTGTLARKYWPWSLARNEASHMWRPMTTGYSYDFSTTYGNRCRSRWRAP